MQFLRRFFQSLRRFFQPKPSTSNSSSAETLLSIPDVISENEILSRAILKPLFFNSQRISENAFLPPPNRGRNDVSLLRFDFTDAHFCKRHAKNLQIPKNEYVGLAVLLAKSINQVNNSEVHMLSSGEILSISLIASPNLEQDLPMHADLLYSHFLIDGEPKILMRKIAKKIIKTTRFLEDANLAGGEWGGIQISRELFPI